MVRAPSLRPQCKARAVTLLELLVVLGLLAAIFALAIPLALRSMQGRAMAHAQIALVAGLETVRAHAQREGVMVELTVDESGRLLRANQLPLDGAEPTPIPSLSFEIESPMRLVVGETGGTVAVFLPDGSAPMTRPCVLRGPDSEEFEQATVTISSLLGRANVASAAVAANHGETPAPSDEAPTPPPRPVEPAPPSTPLRSPPTRPPVPEASS